MKPIHWLTMSLLLLACSGDEEAQESLPEEVTPAPAGQPYDTLSEWGLFDDPAAQIPDAAVAPYEVISPLYSDYSHKRRFLWIPEGAQIGYRDEGKWDFPTGAILVKTFSYLSDDRDPSRGEKLLETRLLVHQAGSWEAHTYVWNAAQTEARRKVAGTFIDASWIDGEGQARQNEYIVPNTNECEECHGEKPDIAPLGPRTRQLNRTLDYGAGEENQIDHLASLGWLDQSPPPAMERPALVDPFGEAPFEDRVRSYLDANCGHCHTEGGTASESALLLSWRFTDPATQPRANWGVCKVPTSAGGATCGHTFDIVPGDPDASIMMCRLASSDPEVRMPPLVSRVPHDEGIELIRSWIAGMDPATCSE